MNLDNWINTNTHSLINKTIAITGSTVKIAQFIVSVFAKLGANFIFINRNKEKTEKQIQELNSLYPNIKAEFVNCDLSKFESVKHATTILKQTHIDILYLAAGVYNVPRFKTEIGYDNVFQTNFISHYYITKELLENIKSVNGKVVAVSSIAHNYSKINENDIDFSTRKQHSKVYGNAKRFLTFSIMELCKQENVNFSIVHPGLTLTEMTNHYPKAINWLVKIFIKCLCPNTEKAGLSLIKGLFENTDYLHWIGPPILQVYGNPKHLKLNTIKNSEINRIYYIAEKIYSKIKKQTN